MFQTEVVEKITTTILGSLKFSLIIVPFLRQSGKICKDRQATDDSIKWRMRFVCWVIKSTDTHSQYIILIAFPREKSFRERSSMKGLHVHCLSSLYLSKLFPDQDS